MWSGARECNDTTVLVHSVASNCSKTSVFAHSGATECPETPVFAHSVAPEYDNTSVLRHSLAPDYIKTSVLHHSVATESGGYTVCLQKLIPSLFSLIVLSASSACERLHRAFFYAGFRPPALPNRKQKSRSIGSGFF